MAKLRTRGVLRRDCAHARLGGSLALPAKTLAVSVLMLTLFFATLGATAAQAAERFALDPASKTQLDRFVERVQRESGTPGVSAAVAVDGRIVYSHGAGYADVENAVPQSGSTVNYIGSISKVIAATGIMQLVEQGKLDLDRPVYEYLPYFPRKFRVNGLDAGPKQYDITLRQILTHTSGIRHYREGEFGEHEILHRIQYTKFEEAIAFWKDDPLLFAPGEYWSYSSHASNLMHGLVEAVTDDTFETYLSEHVWLPAGMLSTQFDVPSRIIAGRGRGYERDERGRLVHAAEENVSYKYAGGGILSSVEDLCRFASAFQSGRLLRPETVEAMWTNQFPTGIVSFSKRNAESPEDRLLEFQQCLSWRKMVDDAGNVSYSHGGSVRGTLTSLVTYPAIDLVVAVHGNSHDIPLDAAARGVAEVFLPPSYRPAAATGEYPGD